MIRQFQVYQQEELIKDISPEDQMFDGNRDAYFAIGKSAMVAILPGLITSQKKNFSRILDFGCGYGRVGRHLRAFFKNAEIEFTDIKRDAIDFCAKTFRGNGFVSSTDFNDLKFTSKYDLIWVGSVFTHIDHERQKILFDKLFSALQPGGILVFTFHGRRCIEMKDSGKIAYIEEGRWNRIVNSYLSMGHGYERYGREDLGDWGISMNTIESIIDLVTHRKNARVVALSEAGWANHQDVIAVKNLD